MSDSAGNAYIRIEINPDDLPAFEAAVGRVVDQRLATLGGHLLATYRGTDAATLADTRLYEPELATLAGYLLATYGHTMTHDNPETEPSTPKADQAEQSPYRDPQPPAVGEPPSVVPPGDGLITSSTVPHKPPTEPIEPPVEQP